MLLLLRKVRVIVRLVNAIVTDFVWAWRLISWFLFTRSTFKPRCARNANAMECRDPAPSKPAGCACPTSASSATRSKIDSMERRAFRSVTVWGTTTKIRSREATGGTKTSRRTPTTWGKRIQFTETGQTIRSRIGEQAKATFQCSLANFLHPQQIQILTEALQSRPQAADAQGLGVLRTIPRILREKSAFGYFGYARASVQRHVDRRRWMRPDVLRTRISDAGSDCRRALRLHLPLVLRSQVQNVSNEEDDPHVSLEILRISKMTIFIDKKLAITMIEMKTW